MIVVEYTLYKLYSLLLTHFCFSSAIIDFLSKYYAKFTDEVQDSQLRSLAKQIPATIFKSRANRTVSLYLRGFGYWQEWCQNFKEIDILPVKSFHFTLYILSCIQNNYSFHRVKQVFYGVRWVHKLLSFKNPCKSSLVISVHEAAKRILSKPIRKKEVITPYDLFRLAKKFGKDHKNLKNMRVLTICVVGFAGFLRYNELANLRCCDIIFHKSYVKLFIESSKTDVYRDGSWVILAKTNSRTCPFKILQSYIKLLNTAPSSDGYIFRGLTFYKKSRSYKLRKANKPLSYSAARKIVLDAFESIGLPKNRFGLHSLRAGGASAAANSGIPDRLFKRHGRWLSDRAKDGYIKDDIMSLLSVTQKLGI